MDQAYGFVAMRLYITRDDKAVSPMTVNDEKGSPSHIEKTAIPNNLTTFVRNSRPNLAGLVEQAADEALNIGRLGIATCGTRSLVTDIKNATCSILGADRSDIFCHAEEFDY